MPYTPHDKRDPHHGQHDRREKIAVGTAIVGVIVVALSAIFTGWTAWIMRDQITVMEAQQRPWVDGKPIPDNNGLGLYWGPDTGYLMLAVQTRNVGQAVAEGLRIETKLVAIPEIKDPIVDSDRVEEARNVIVSAQDALCNEMSEYNPFITPKTFGEMLFPNDQRTDSQIGSVDISDIRISLGKAKVPTFLPVIVGCIDYRFYVTPTHHQTRFAYVARIKDRQPFENAGIKIGEQIPNGSLMFEKYEWGNGAAD